MNQPKRKYQKHRMTSSQSRILNPLNKSPTLESTTPDEWINACKRITGQEWIKIAESIKNCEWIISVESTTCPEYLAPLYPRKRSLLKKESLLGLLEQNFKKIVILFHPFTPKKESLFFILYKIEHEVYIGGSTEIWIPDLGDAFEYDEIYWWIASKHTYLHYLVVQW